MRLSSPVNRLNRGAVFVALSVILVTVGLSGCMLLKTQSAEEKARKKAIKNHKYSTDIDQVVEEAETLLSYQAYIVQGPEADYDVTTDWKQYDFDSPHGKKRKRYLVKASNNQVFMYYKVEEQTRERDWIPTAYTTGTKLPRDLEMEFKLIKRVEPKQAKQIEAKAKKAAQKNKKTQ